MYIMLIPNQNLQVHPESQITPQLQSTRLLKCNMKRYFAAKRESQVQIQSKFLSICCSPKRTILLYKIPIKPINRKHSMSSKTKIQFVEIAKETNWKEK